MKTSIINNVLIFFMCGYLAFLPGCKSDSTTNSQNTPPNAIPQETMMFDISDFPTQGTSSALSKGQGPTHAKAAFAVVVVNVWVFLGLAVPVLATAHAFNDPDGPSFDEATGKWHWENSGEFVNQTINLELTGQINGDVINWEFFVTRSLPTPLDRFLWYIGETRIDGTQGFWQFYDETKPEANHNNLKIDFVYNSVDDRTLIFENNNTENAGFGDMLTYSVDGVNFSMTLVDVSESKTTEIAWDKSTGEGYIDENGTRECWGAAPTFPNEVCSSN